MRPDYPVVILLAALVTFSILARPAMADGNGLGGNPPNQWNGMPGNPPSAGGNPDQPSEPARTNEGSFILSTSGMAIVAVLVTSVAVAVYMISHKIIKREEKTQMTKYVDRWEGSEEKQREALDYISKAKKKKTAQNTSVDSDSAGN